MYRWIVFLHVFSAFAWLLVHGVYAAVMLKFRGEADPERSLTFFNALPNSMRLGRFLLALVVIIGLIAGFMQTWWKQGWMWAAVALLAVISIVMNRYGAGYFDVIEKAAMRAVEQRKNQSAPPTDPDAFAAARVAWRPIGMTVVGLVGLAVILWLMMFKPF